MVGLKSPFGNTINIENGTLEDYYRLGGTDDDIPDYVALAGRHLYGMKIRTYDRIQFEIQDPEEYNERLMINAWALRVDVRRTPDDFRFCTTLAGVIQQRVLRGWNQ